MGGMMGVLGGTFDPPHLGHLILAEEGRVGLDLEAVLWVVTGDPPHKTGESISPLEIRLQMVEAAIEDNTHFQLSRADIERPPPHFSIGTMEWLAERYPERGFTYLMGSDSLNQLPTWHQPARFVQLCDAIGVLHRFGAETDKEELEAHIPGISVKVRQLEGQLVPISGGDIRERVREGKSFRYLVPNRVFEIIQRLALYR